MKEKPVVLIVDDAASNIQVLAACLKGEYRLKIATSGEACLNQAVMEPQPDLILLDIIMPNMDGYEVCRRLKDDPATQPIPIIFVTGRESDEDEEMGLKLGAVDYITKPVRPAIVAARAKTHVTMKQQRDALKKLALQDQLTGLYNRHYLVEMAHHKVSRALRHHEPLSVMMMDIDHFKAVNDNHGHPAGDAILIAVAKQINALCRSDDVVARYGGEEFVVLLDQCDHITAQQKADKIRAALEVLNPCDIAITMSIGVAQLQAHDVDFDGCLKRADLALYQAKEQGRNRVITADKTPQNIEPTQLLKPVAR